MQKNCSINLPVGILAVAVLGSILPATAANGSNPPALASTEYREAIDRADRDYAKANRRCEILGMRERKLCVHDSAAARGAAVIEAQAKRSHPAQAAR